MAATGRSAAEIVEAQGLVQVSDRAAIEKRVDGLLADFPEEVQAYRSGRKKLLGFFVGRVMKATRGRANPQVVNEVLKEKLKQ